MLETKLVNYIISLSFSENGKPNLNQHQIRINNIYDKKNSLKIIRKKLNEKFIKFDNSRAEYLYILNSIFYKEVVKEFDPVDTIITLGKNCKELDNQSFVFYDKICKIELKKFDII